jgi:NAD(P)-dependent dehydrogenase (short-subunit alcohol dehydrogenase family)
VDKPVVLITGAARGLGKEIAEFLAKNQYKVFAAMRTLPLDHPVNQFPIKLDLTNDDDMKQAVDTIISSEGKIDIIIHNSASLHVGSPDTFTPEELKQLFQVNVFGPVRLTQLALPHMRKQSSGKIIFITSIYAIENHAYYGAYCATKAGIEAIAFDWAVTLSHWNIQVSIVQPGPLLTNPTVSVGSYFQTKNNPYPPSPGIDFIWQSPGEVCTLLAKVIKEKTPLFRYQTGSYAEQVVAEHVHDISCKKWLDQQLEWFKSAKSV